MDLGLTQHTLALKLGVGYSAVAGWESGAFEPLAARWPAIEGVLGTGLIPEHDDLPGRVRAARLRLGLRQEDLARMAGIDVRTVRNTERGLWRPSRRTARKLVAVVGRLS